MASTTKIPVYVIAGWLGSGKTSFLNQLLTQTVGLKIGAVVNDFGDINIDAGLIDQQVDEVVSLSNGCLCCSLSNELDDSLDKLTAAEAKLDAIFVEASGIADPAQMAKLIIDSQNFLISFHDIIYIIDAVNFQQLVQDKEHLVRTGLSVATLVLINKIDLANPDQVVFAETIVREINPQAVIVRTTQGKIDANLLFDHAERTNVQLRLGQTDQHQHDDHHHHHDPINLLAVSGGG